MERFNISNSGKTAKIKLIGAIDWWDNNSKQFTNQIDQLINSGCTDVELYLNTAGGSMIEANEIGNQIQRFTGKKTVKLGAICASAGTCLSTYFNTVEASANTQYMIHDPSMGIMVEHLSDFDSAKKLYTNLRNDVISRYNKKTKISKEEISNMMTAVTWMEATEAKQKGFVDSISTESDNLFTPDAKNLLNKYKNVPAEVLNMANQTHLISKEMDKTKLTKKLGLEDSASEQEIEQAIENLQNKANQSAQNEKQIAIDNLVAKAKEKGLDADTIKNLASKDFESTQKLVESTVNTAIAATPDKNVLTVERLSDAFKNAVKDYAPVKADVKDKTFDDYAKDEKSMQDLIENNWTVFAKLYADKFGKEPLVSEVENLGFKIKQSK